jgi:ABC-2 type transport system permease protein
MLRTESPIRSGWVPNFTGLWAFIVCEFRVQFHEKVAILTSIVVQVVLLVFVGVLAPALFGIALVGAIVFSFFTLGGRVQNEAAFVRVDHRLNQLYLASPLTAESYFLGMSVGVLAAYLPPIVLLAVLAEVVLHLSALSALVLLGTVLAVWVFSISLGYTISTLFRDMRAIWPYQSLIYNLFGVLPPVFYPLYLFPDNLRTLALVIPPSAAAGLVQSTIGVVSLPIGQVELAAFSLATEALVMFLFAIYWARRTVRED